METRCMCFCYSMGSLHHSRLVDGGFACCMIQSKHTEMGHQFSLSPRGSFVTISVVKLTLHDQKSGCLMFYQRQLGGCLSMYLPNSTLCLCVSLCVCMQAKCSLFVTVLVCPCVCIKRRQRTLGEAALLMCWWGMKG